MIDLGEMAQRLAGLPVEDPEWRVVAEEEILATLQKVREEADREGYRRCLEHEEEDLKYHDKLGWKRGVLDARELTRGCLGECYNLITAKSQEGT